MTTKIVAARMEAAAGVTTVITRSGRPGNIVEVVNFAEAQKKAADILVGANGLPEIQDSVASSIALSNRAEMHGVPTPELDEPISRPLHTRFLPDPYPMENRLVWLLYGLTPRGSIYIDAIAFYAMTNGLGLLSTDVVDAEGDFDRSQCVRLCARPSTEATLSEGMEVGRTLVNCSVVEIRQTKRARKSHGAGTTGHDDGNYAVLNRNAAFFKEAIFSASVSGRRRR